MKNYILIISIITLAFLGCQPAAEQGVDPTGTWRVSFDLGEVSLPTMITISASGENQYTASLVNGEETLDVERVTQNGDTLSLRMAIFDTEMVGVINAEGKWEGTFTNYSRSKDYQIPFSAEKGLENRFRTQDSVAVNDISGRWETYFSPDDAEGGSPGIGIFQQDGKNVKGTFLTETGDYRFLEGVAEGDHVFLFLADKNAEGKLNGTFYSGTHWVEPFVGELNEEFELRNPDELTYLKPGYEKMAFSFPDLEGNMVSLEDPVFQDKVVVVQIMGSWCPNCMDETRFYTDWYRKNSDQPVEIIGLAYENKPDFKYASERVQKMKAKLNVPYEFLIAGTSDKEEASKTLPMLNAIISFPTSIFLDKNGDVRKIHTGFSGPGTGEDYENWKKSFEALMTEMLAE